MTAFEQAQKDFAEELQSYLANGYAVSFGTLCAPKDNQPFRIDLIRDDTLVRISAEYRDSIDYVCNVGRKTRTFIVETREYQYRASESRERKLLDENMNARCIHFVKGADLIN